MSIDIVNLRTNRKAQGNAIHRGTPLGNPFVIGRDGTREEVIAQYRPWLRAQWKENGQPRALLIQLAREYKEQGALTLLCWCKPLACHGDVIAEAVMALVRKGLV